MHITAITVLGDHGHEYTVRTEIDGTVHCTCPAYKFAEAPKTCKHITFLTRQLTLVIMEHEYAVS